MRSAILSLALLSLISLPLGAADYVIDGGHSSVVFKIGHLGASDFYGRFNDVSGTIRFDENDLKASSVKVVVKSGSVDTNSSNRDDHVKSPELLNSEKHPEIVFEAKGFKEGKKPGIYQVNGTMKFNGVSKKITVTAKKIGSVNHQRFGQRIGFSCTFTIKRTEYNVKFPTNVLSDEVELMVALEGLVEKKEE